MANFEIGDFVENLSFDPPEKGRVIGVDPANPKIFVVKVTSGHEQNIRAHNLRKLEKRSA